MLNICAQNYPILSSYTKSDRMQRCENGLGGSHMWNKTEIKTLKHIVSPFQSSLKVYNMLKNKKARKCEIKLNKKLSSVFAWNKTIIYFSLISVSVHVVRTALSKKMVRVAVEIVYLGRMERYTRWIHRFHEYTVPVARDACSVTMMGHVMTGSRSDTAISIQSTQHRIGSKYICRVNWLWNISTRHNFNSLFAYLRKFIRLHMEVLNDPNYEWHLLFYFNSYTDENYMAVYRKHITLDQWS